MKKSFAAILLIVIIGVMFALVVHFSGQSAPAKKQPPQLPGLGEKETREDSSPLDLLKGPLPSSSSQADREIADLRAQVVALSARVTSLESEKKKNSSVIKRARETFNMPAESPIETADENSAVESVQSSETPSASPGIESSEPAAPTTAPGKNPVTESVMEVLKSDEARQAVIDIVHREQVRQQIQRNFGSKEEFRKKLDGAVEWAAKEFNFTESQKIGTNATLDRFVDKVSVAAEEAIQNGKYEEFKQKQNQYESELRDEIIDLLDRGQLDKVKQMDPHGFGKRIEERGL